MVRPTETGRSKSALHQISIGLRWMARRVESDPRGFSGRRGYGGTKSLGAADAVDMAVCIERGLRSKLKRNGAWPTEAGARMLLARTVAGQNAVRWRIAVASVPSSR
jgi:hypothetical protein